MNFKSFLIAACLMFSVSLTFAQGISFEKGSWEDVVKKAKAENKHIFVDAFADWCGPCKRMAKEVFPESSVGTFFNKNYISYKFDMEKGEGPEFAVKYMVSAYPTLLFFNPNGELVHKSVGGMDGATFVSLGEDALNPEKQVYTLTKKFEAGERNKEFLVNYIEALISANENAAEVSEIYFNTIPKNEWATMENFILIARTQSSIESNIFTYILNNRAIFDKGVGSEYVDMLIEKVYNDEISTVSKNQDQKAADELKANMKKYLGKKAESLCAFLDLNYNLGGKDELKYAQIYFEKYCEDAAQLNSIAWYYFENETDKSKLKAALKWAEKSVKLDKNWQNLDTQANLHFVLGNKKAALAAAEEAVKMANDIGEDASDTKALIRKIKK